MKKKKTLIIACITLLVSIALSMLFAYLEWQVLWVVIVIFAPFVLMAMTNNGFARFFVYIGACFLIFFAGLAFTWQFTRIIIVKGSIGDTASYTVEKVRTGSVYEYCDASGKTKTIVVKGSSVINETKSPLRLYEVTYSNRFTFGVGEKNLIEIPPCSAVKIPRYPDYILESPPESITVRTKTFDFSDKTETRTVLSFE